jgi:demethylmenaquinone methyltransferase/2-methoxy-6-polyprenyl-1,4-benzoquinol methylase
VIADIKGNVGATRESPPQRPKNDRILLPMSYPAEKRDGRLMRKMFGAIATRYDFITRVFSYGMDRRWKQLGVRRASLPDGAMVLDLACGTGDFSEIVLRSRPGARVVAVDLTEQMLRVARRRVRAEVVCADALALPFADGSFDCVFVGYGLRNFPDLTRALAEIHRVTRAGGKLVSLDFFLPTNWLWREVYLGYLYAQGAIWGLLLHGRSRMYTYIPDSLRGFISIADFSSLLQRMGYARVEAQAFILGGIGLHWGVKRECGRVRVQSKSKHRGGPAGAEGH